MKNIITKTQLSHFFVTCNKKVLASLKNPWHLVLHPFLIVTYPILFVYTKNTNEVDPSTFLGYWSKTMIITAVIWFVFHLIYKRDIHKSAMITGVFLYILLNYGVIYDGISRITIFGRSLGGGFYNLYMLLFGFIAFTVLLWRHKNKEHIKIINTILTITFALLIIVQLYNKTIPRLSKAWPSYSYSWQADPTNLGLTNTDQNLTKRDIYYFIFDRYPNEKTLLDRYDFDNSDFYKMLESKGFFVPKSSFSNYPVTATSLSSSLNLEYLDDLQQQLGDSGTGSQVPLYKKIRDNVAAKYLQDQGYKFINVASWFTPTHNIPAADVQYRYAHDITILGKRLEISEFTSLLIPSSIIKPLVVRPIHWGKTRLISSDIGFFHLNTTLSQIEGIAEAAKLPDNKFVFAHLILPHPPYTFDKDGSLMTNELVVARKEDENFINQLQYTNVVIEDMLDNILEHSKDPIIVIQSDEGPYFPRLTTMGSRFLWKDITDEELNQKEGIINAYRLPGVDAEKLVTDEATPVNTFRHIFNEYFDQKLKILENKHYIFYDGQYNFHEVTNRIDKTPTS